MIELIIVAIAMLPMFGVLLLTSFVNKRDQPHRK